MLFDIRRIGIEDVNSMCAKYHGYGRAGGTTTYAFGVFEMDRIVAAFSWQPPPFGAAKACAPGGHHGVLALSRMVAVPKSERAMKHISKPLMIQMKQLIDRTRWPVLVTWHDESLGHTGHVYRCSGWTLEGSSTVRIFEEEGTRNRISVYSSGSTKKTGIVYAGTTVIHRWTHRMVPKGSEWEYMEEYGWRLVESGKVWKSGNSAKKVINIWYE